MTRAAALAALAALTLVACAADSDDGASPVDVPVEGSVHETGFNLPLPDLSMGNSVTVTANGAILGVFVAQGGRVNVPCDATSVKVQYTYSNQGTLTAAAHQNTATFAGSTTSTSMGSLSPLLSRTTFFTQSLAGALPDKPAILRIRLDDPSALTETNEGNNEFSFYIQRACL